MNKITINTDGGKYLINRNIYGHFAEHLGRCIYDGIWVGEDSKIPNTRGMRNDIVAALKKISIPVLRWPGGCFADEYHWRDGIGPRAQRPCMINTHWGGVTENNHFGTHEFMDLCEQLKCEPYICGNVGSGTVQEMQQWVEYITFGGVSPMADLRRKNGRKEPWKIKYWGVGNENWGCGGHMRPEYYADLYRQFQTYLRNFGDNQLYKIAGGSHDELYHWTAVLMQQAAKQMHGLSLHCYSHPGAQHASGSATNFGEGEWFSTLKSALRIEGLIKKHGGIMDRYDAGKKVGMIVDEWGSWYAAEPGTNPRFLYQQNSLRDALVAGVSLHVFHRHCDRVTMANIAQTINVLQAMVLTDGAKMLLTPTYHVFEMFKIHHDATLLPLELTCDQCEGEPSLPGISASGSRNKQGQIHLSLCNLEPNKPAEITCVFQGGKVSKVSGRILTADTITAHNTFDQPEAVQPVPFDQAKFNGDALTVNLPAKSVVVLELS